MEVAGANRRWSSQFRCRGSRRESAVAQLFSLGRLHVMGYTLHPAVVKEAQRLFGQQDIDYVLTKLADSTLPMERSAPPPRVHLAVIWLSKGERKWFDYQIGGAQCDWRDTLVEAGLAGDDWRTVVSKRGIDCSDW